ncbi:hypothetical protein WA026_012420 [Henosepilachna vigintioctopunctata]|uniref:Uncharacterized protein n=1 Tax=Henosepilachna vigintioctopunctata TaxID=420089 RepID=A0AAW1UQ38_9CUCU
MSPLKKKSKQEVNFSTESNSTEYDAEPLVTDSEATNSLGKELRAAIDTMGPDSPRNVSDHFLENEEILNTKELNQYKQVYDVVPTPAEEAIQELYKKDKSPSVMDYESEVDVENILNADNSKCSTSNECLIVRPMKAEMCRPIYKNGKDIIAKKCLCHSKENYICMQREPTNETPKRFSRLYQHSITKWLKNRGPFCRRETDQTEKVSDYYKMYITEPDDDHSPPRRVIFNLVDELPKPKCTSVGVNTKPTFCNYGLQSKNIKDQENQRAKCSIQEEESVKEYETINKRNETIQQKIKGCRCGSPARVDVYYFDHGNASYLRTTDNPPLIRTEIVADQSEECNTKFWGEIFGSVHIGTSFITAFILQFLRFLLQSIIRPLTVGLIQILSDYFLKPCLATIFNAIVQPPLIFLYNVSTSLRDICDPISEGIGYFIREISVVCKSCRLIETKKCRSCDSSCFQNIKNSPNLEVK